MGYIVKVVPCWVADTLIQVPSRKRDDRWIAFVEDHFGLSENVLRRNIKHGDDTVLLAILIHVTRQVIGTASLDP
jgi:hypothetical protein